MKKQAQFGVLVALLVVYAVVLIRTAWICDDAYITLRTVDNLLGGHGLTWNPAERVQTYTHPLWMLLLVIPHAITGGPYAGTIWFSMLVSLTAVAVFARLTAPTLAWGIVGIVALVCSQAFMDYSTSGLENPASYLFVVAFVALWRRHRQFGVRTLAALTLIAALGVLTRLDTLLLFAPALMVAAVQTRDRRSVALAQLGWAPLVVWGVFSLVYYGSLFPNTALAKLPSNIGLVELSAQGLRYLEHSLTNDPVTLLVIVVAIVVPVAMRRRGWVLSLGVLLYVLYVVRIGGDYMAGRFLATPLCLAVCTLAVTVKLRSWPAIALVSLALAGLSSLFGTATFLSGPDHGMGDARMGDQQGIVDERSFFYRHTGWLRADRTPGTPPEHPFVERGEAWRKKASTQPVQMVGVVGLVGYTSGPEVHIIDTMGLTDPFLARLPTCKQDGWRIGHFKRVVPPGYGEAVVGSPSRITDAGLAEAYEAIQLVTREPLMAHGRWRAIWDLSTGRYKKQLSDVPYECPSLAERKGPSTPPMGPPPDAIVAGENKGMNPDDPAASGRWRRFRTHTGDAGITREQKEMMERLEAIGYAQGTQSAREQQGVTIHDASRAFPGLNLYTSGHAPEAVLMDMDGRVLHTWTRAFRDVWPDYPIQDSIEGTQFWRRVHLLPDGSLLAIHEGLGIVKLDRDSNVVWENPNRAHHDLQVMDDGTIYVLTREARIIEALDPQRPAMDEAVVVLSADGKELRRVSLVDCFMNSPSYADFWEKSRKTGGEMFHSNAVRVLDGSLASKVEAFTAGRVLVSIRFLSALVVVDLEAAEVVWAVKGEFAEQHDPDILDDGHILLFDNAGMLGRSRVLEIDVETLETVWQYGVGRGEPMYTKNCGTNQRLANGNTLVTESENGRAIEVTPRGQIVWEYINPERAGPHGTLIATLFEVERLDPSVWEASK